MFEFEFFAGIAGGVGIALIVWWVVDRQRAQNRPHDDAATATRDKAGNDKALFDEWNPRVQAAHYTEARARSLTELARITADHSGWHFNEKDELIFRYHDRLVDPATRPSDARAVHVLVLTQVDPA